ncbi:hypothetical protein TanjilG_09516 [Lupinus angustifolius]|uniref:TCP domain-containing protein n=1 Tax=Lupinus angustifolius TaxID=3871 RepID=A0A1J7FVI7_LUPAN|nr:PREDICTED: transcription factor TCP24-like isoform X1 [Lupinus angustifolius]XP_019424608.1 PREDICTED: transcription factor TCP24-like isoform X1 [Lupinus angustifolius]XP_019424609.1 PREDICTED: transcription factor TCP24-like isoform X1 [Lupinus angustifolius]OIV91975.1 hypothetical protein TanjilG_09516 [Lupinus angustifolius]
MDKDDEIQAQACKFPRIGNGSNKLGSTRGNEEEDKRRVGGCGNDGSTNHFNSGSNWNNSSRIVRVSRASGGKDRHSKVMTSKGLRDRRVRLSVTTAIQFYDLQDRLGFEQPSKAVEWLINAASDSISELPSLNTTFPDTPNQPSDEKRPSFDEVDVDTNNYHQNQNQKLSLSKSACSSTSETSKGSGLSLSRPEICVKAREGGTKDKEKEYESSHHITNHHHNVSQTASFTELLTGGFGNVPTTTSANASDECNLFNKAKQWSPMVMDYFNNNTLMVGPSSSSRNVSLSPFSDENHSVQLQHFSFIPDHNFIPCSQPSENLNFTISPTLAGYNRGTLQSNSQPHLMHPMQRFSSPIDGSNNNLPFFIGGSSAHSASAASTMDTGSNHHQQLQFSPLFDGSLQLCYGDGTQHSEQKGKAKN